MTNITPTHPLPLSTSLLAYDTTLYIGGFGAVVGTRNFTANGAIQGLGDVNTLLGYAYMGEDPLRFGSRYRKSEIDMTLHEDQHLDDADLSAHPLLGEAMEVYCDAWCSGKCSFLIALPLDAPPCIPYPKPCLYVQEMLKPKGFVQS